MTCRICFNTSGNEMYELSELMYGTGETFKYFQCRRCGCLQIASIPTGDSLYRTDYHSFGSETSSSKGAAARARKARTEWMVLGRRRVVGSVVARRMPYAPLSSLSPVRLLRSDNVLDVGCGAGGLLQLLRDAGFENLQGLEPYLPVDITVSSVPISRCDIVTFHSDREWQCIMFHHSFEHLPDPVAALSKASALLSASGTCIVRVPVLGEAWDKFGGSWIQLDPPRHFYLHTSRSMEIVAQSAGLYLERVVYDSTAFQFWGSVQAQRGVPLLASDSYAINRREAAFKRSEIRKFSRVARTLNGQQRGDQAAFYLRKLVD